MKKIALLILLLIFVALAALPTWISTPAGTQTVLRLINSRVEGHVTAEKVKISWLGSQHFENVSWVDCEGKPIFSVRLLDTETSLLSLLLGRRSIQKTVIEEPYLYLSAEMTEKMQNEKEKKSHRSSSSRKSRFPRFKDAFFVRNGTFIVASSQISPITISQIQIEKQAGAENFHMTAQTAQASMLGSITVDASLAQKLLAHVNVQQFPVAILDELQGTTLFTDVLGPSLSLELDLEQEEGASLSIKGSAASVNLKGYIEGVSHEGLFTLNPQTQLNFLFTPNLFKSLVAPEQRQDWDLASKTEIIIDVQEGVFPLKFKKRDFEKIVFRADVSIERAELHHLDLGSYSLKQFKGTIASQNNNLEFIYAGEIQGKEKTTLSGTISVTPEKKVLFKYDYLGFPATLLSLFSTDLERNVRTIFGSQFDLHSQGTWDDGDLDANVKIDSTLTKLNAQLIGTLPEIHFDITGATQISAAKAKVFGNSLEFTATGKGDLTDNHLTIPFIKGTIFNPYLSFDFKGSAGKDPHSIQLTSTGIIKKLPLLAKVDTSSLENTTAFIQVDGKKNQISVRAEGPGLDLRVRVHQFIHDGKIDMDLARVHFTTELKNFPVEVLSPFISENIDLTQFIGDKISLEAKGGYTPMSEPKLSIDLQAESSGFAASLAISLDGTLVVKENIPSTIVWEITPERYIALMRQLRIDPSVEPTYLLTNNTTLQFNISQFTCPTTLPKDLSDFLCRSGFVGNVTLGKTIFRSIKTNESITFEGITGSIHGVNFSEGINLNLGGNINAENIPKTEQSSFSFEGQMINFWTPEGHFNREGLTLKGVLSLDLIPVRHITGLVPLDQDTRALANAVLGELMNARIYGEISQMRGPLTIDIKANNFKANLPLQLEPHAILLRDYVDAEITLTDAINETLLADISPLFIAGAYSDHPLKLYIEPQGFSIPIRPYALQGVSIGRAKLDIGRIHVRNGGQVQRLLEFLKAQDIAYDGMMEAWFTPIYITLQNGVGSYSRFDVLLGRSVHIAMWGSINLINDQVAMTLAIGAPTIAQRLKIKGLKKTEMFQVKMRGTTHKLDLDWSSAYTRIAFVVARTAGGQLGQLIGGILEPLIPAFGEEPVPPPTTSPFPWESQYP